MDVMTLRKAIQAAFDWYCGLFRKRPAPTPAKQDRKELPIGEPIKPLTTSCGGYGNRNVGGAFCCSNCGRALVALPKPSLTDFTTTLHVFCPSGHGIDGTGRNIHAPIWSPLKFVLDAAGMTREQRLFKVAESKLAEFRAEQTTQKENSND